MRECCQSPVASYSREKERVCVCGVGVGGGTRFVHGCAGAEPRRKEATSRSCMRACGAPLSAHRPQTLSIVGPRRAVSTSSTYAGPDASWQHARCNKQRVLGAGSGGGTHLEQRQGRLAGEEVRDILQTQCVRRQTSTLLCVCVSSTHTMRRTSGGSLGRAANRAGAVTNQTRAQVAGSAAMHARQAQLSARTCSTSLDVMMT